MLVSDLCPKRRTVLIVDLVGRDRMMFIHVVRYYGPRSAVFMNQHKKPMTLFFFFVRKRKALVLDGKG